jgi:hypothetical protein
MQRSRKCVRRRKSCIWRKMRSMIEDQGEETQEKEEEKCEEMVNRERKD